MLLAAKPELFIPLLQVVQRVFGGHFLDYTGWVRVFEGRRRRERNAV